MPTVVKVPPLATDLTEPLVTTVQSLLETNWLAANTESMGANAGGADQVRILKEDFDGSGSHIVTVMPAFDSQEQITVGQEPYWEVHAHLDIHVYSTRLVMQHKIEREINRIIKVKAQYKPLNSAGAASGIKNISVVQKRKQQDPSKFAGKYHHSVIEARCLFWEIIA